MMGGALPDLLVTTLGEVTALIIAVSALVGSISALLAAYYGHRNKTTAENVKEKIENGGGPNARG